MIHITHSLCILRVSLIAGNFLKKTTREKSNNYQNGQISINDFDSFRNFPAEEKNIIFYVWIFLFVFYVKYSLCRHIYRNITVLK